MTIANQTGWSEEKILNLPLERGFQYLHAIAAANGEVTKAQ